jgi:hypothetical protein
MKAPLSSTRKIEVTAAVIAILIASFGAVKAWIILPYEVAELQQAQNKTNLDHDTLVRVDTTLQSVLREIEAQHREIQIALRLKVDESQPTSARVDLPPAPAR